MSEENKPKNVKVGALWSRQSQSSNTKYLAGTVEIEHKGEKITKKVVVFKNNHKDTDRHPDYNMYESRPMPEKATAQVADNSADDDLLYSNINKN